MTKFLHLRLLNINLEHITGGGRDVLPFLFGRHKKTTDIRRIAQATGALVDDYAKFHADHENLGNLTTIFFDELRKLTRFVNLQYCNHGGGGQRTKSLSELQRLIDGGYYLEGELPRTNLPVQCFMAEFSFGFRFPSGYDNGEIVSDGRIVRSQRWGDYHEFTTLCQTGYFGEGFNLERIHSQHYKSRRPVIDV